VIQLTPQRPSWVSVASTLGPSPERAGYVTGVEKFADVSDVIYRSLSLQNIRIRFPQNSGS